MKRCIRLFAVILAVPLVVLGPQRAKADDGTTVDCNDEQVCTVVVDDDGGAGKTGGDVGSGTCTWKGKKVPCTSASGTYDPTTECYVEPADPMPTSGPVFAEYQANGGSIVWETCPDGGPGGYVWRAAAVARPQVTAELVREQARRLVPTASIGLAPHGSTLVNIETVMWADAPAEQDLPVVTLLGRRVAIHLRLEHVRWTFGDGGSAADGPAGKPYDAEGAPCRERLCAAYFGHVYVRAGSEQVGAVASWHASFTVDGGAVQQIDAPVPGPQARAEIRVKQARAVLVPNPGEH